MAVLASRTSRRQNSASPQAKLVLSKPNGGVFQDEQSGTSATFFVNEQWNSLGITHLDANNAVRGEFLDTGLAEDDDKGRTANKRFTFLAAPSPAKLSVLETEGGSASHRTPILDSIDGVLSHDSGFLLRTITKLRSTATRKMKNLMAFLCMMRVSFFGRLLYCLRSFDSLPMTTAMRLSFPRRRLQRLQTMAATIPQATRKTMRSRWNRSFYAPVYDSSSSDTAAAAMHRRRRSRRSLAFTGEAATVAAMARHGRSSDASLASFPPPPRLHWGRVIGRTDVSISVFNLTHRVNRSCPLRLPRSFLPFHF